MKGTWNWSALALFGVLTACGGDEAPEGLPEATLADIQQHIFVPACANSGCHDAEVAAGELNLSTAQISYDSLVGRPAKNAVAKANGWILVKPGEPGKSFLVRKMIGPGAGEGDPMPSAAQQVHPTYMGLIEEWIEKGAPR